MTTYAAVSKATGLDELVYSADAPVEYQGFEFATHDHIARPDPPPAPPPASTQVGIRWTGIEFLRRFTPLERIAARTRRQTDPILHDFFSLLEQADEAHSNDPDVIRGLQYMVDVDIITTVRRDAILGVA